MRRVGLRRHLIIRLDLASSHYTETVSDFMIESKINFLEKYENPANLPECRPIEQFWAVFSLPAYVHDLHLSGWNIMRHSFAQLTSASRSFCICSKSPLFLITPMILLSSAKSLIISFYNSNIF